MMLKVWVRTVLVISTLCTFVAHCGLEIIPERAKVMYMNDKYFYNYTINVKRYSRTSPYRVNMEMTTKQSWNNNVTVCDTVSTLRAHLLSLCGRWNYPNIKFLFSIDATIYILKVNIVFNEYLHNEYRRSFVELHYKFCDLMHFDKFIGPIVVAIGLGCPMPPGILRFGNFSFNMDKFPNVFPFEKTRLDAELTITATNETMAKVYHYITFKNKN